MSDPQVQAPATGPQPSPTAAPVAPPEPSTAKQVGAKVLQSATLGFGADAAGKVWGKDSEIALRKLAQQYDDKHPLAGFAIDLATAGATALIPFGGEAADAAKVPSLMAKGAALTKSMMGRTAVGGAVGGAAGVGAGGNADQRVTHGLEGAGTGAAAALGLGMAGQYLLKPVFDRLGSAGYSQAKAAADAIKDTLTKEGKSVEGMNKFMTDNPGSRIVDYSPKVADLVSKAADKSNDTARQLAEQLRSDQAAQQVRIARQAQPLLGLKNEMMETAQKLATQRDALYAKGRGSEVVPVNDALKKILSHPDVAPLYQAATEETTKARAAGRLADLPEVPDGHTSSYALDETQRKLGAAAKDPSVAGTGQQGTLTKLQGDLNGHLTPVMQKAQERAAQVGGLDRAQDWGHGYAKGLKISDISDFRQMSPLEQQYARLGIANGLEDYIRSSGRLTEGQFTGIADALRDPAMVEVLGKRDAAQAAKIFKGEAARAQTNAGIARGASNRTALNDLIQENSAGHVVNAVTKGLGGSAIRMVQRLGMTEPQARSIIDIATKPGGIDRLRKSGIDKNTLDKLQSMVKIKGAMSGAATQAGREQDLSQ